MIRPSVVIAIAVASATLWGCNLFRVSSPAGSGDAGGGDVLVDDGSVMVGDAFVDGGERPDRGVVDGGDRADGADLGSAPLSRARSAFVSSFQTDSARFVPVPGGRVTFTPEDVDEVWVVLVSAALGSESLNGGGSADETVEARYTINGTPRGLGGTQVSEPHAAGPWQHFEIVTGTTDPQDVQVELRDVPGTEASLASLRLLALPLPAGADPHFMRVDEEQLVPNTDFETAATMDLRADRAGTYLVFGLVNATERPGRADIDIRWETPDGQQWPEGATYRNATRSWQSLFMARAVELGRQPSQFHLHARHGNSDATISHVRMLAFRVDAFGGSWSFEDPDGVSSAEPRQIGSLSVPASPTPADHLVVMSTRVSQSCSLPDDEVRGSTFELDGTPLIVFDHAIDNCSHRITYGTFALHSTEAAFDLEMGLNPDGAELDAREAVIHALRLD